MALCACLRCRAVDVLLCINREYSTKSRDDGTVVYLHQEELSNALVLLVLEKAGRDALRLVGGRLLAAPPLLFQLQKIVQCIDERNFTVIIQGK